MGFLWELFQQRRIWDAQLDASQARERADFTGNIVRELQSRLDRLELVVEALCTLLRDKGVLTEKEIAGRIQEVDLADGLLDGSYTRPPVQCPRCGRVVSPRRPTCTYCGAELPAPAPRPG
jgi:hypothetical protein